MRRAGPTPAASFWRRPNHCIMRFLWYFCIIAGTVSFIVFIIEKVKNNMHSFPILLCVCIFVRYPSLLFFCRISYYLLRGPQKQLLSIVPLSRSRRAKLETIVEFFPPIHFISFECTAFPIVPWDGLSSRGLLDSYSTDHARHGTGPGSRRQLPPGGWWASWSRRPSSTWHRPCCRPWPCCDGGGWAS